MIELLLVVAIIGIIAAIAIPSLAGAREAARENAAIATLRELANSQYRYMIANGRYARAFELPDYQLQRCGPMICRQGLQFRNYPAIMPTDSQLQSGFSMAAVGTRSDGSIMLFQVDESGLITKVF